MITATRNWLRRNRTTIAIGAGVVGGVYFAGTWALGKLNEARQRMSDDRIAKENLRRRFKQNQEDCTYTVLALLPTAYENIDRALPVEDILGELQARKTEKIARSTQVSTAGSEIAPSEIGTEDGSQGTGSFVHASQAIGQSGEGEDLGRKVSGKSKILLWEELKIASITRALTLLYVLPLLTLLTRIQLNLLGRRTYLSSVVSLASPPATHAQTTSSDTPPDFQQPASPISLENNDDDRSDYYGNDFATNRAYLTFSWWLLHRGWALIQERVEDSVREVFGPWNPRDNVSFEKLAELILEVRKRVEGRDEEERSKRRWLGYLLPPKDEEVNVLRESGMLNPAPGSPPGDSSLQTTTPSAANPITPSLRRLLDETSDLIDSPTFTHVLTLALDATFSLLIDGRVGPAAYKVNSMTSAAASRPESSSSAFAGPTPRVVDVTDDPSATPTAKLATVLATFTKQAAAIGRGGDEAIASISSPAMGIGMGEGSGLRDANEYLAAVEGVRDLEAFAAVVYSSNFEFEGVSDEEWAQGGGQEEEGKGLPTARDIEKSFVEVRGNVEEKLESAWDKARSLR